MNHQKAGCCGRVVAIAAAGLLVVVPPAVAGDIGGAADVEVAQANEASAETPQDTDGAANASTPLRGFGGKAATGRIVRQIRKQHLDAQKKKPKSGDALQDWLEGPSVLGDWGGYRGELEDRGITFGGFSANVFLTNATGGNRRSWAYTHLTMAETNLDFERLAGLSGFLIRAQMAFAAGNNLSSSNRIGNLFNVATAYTPNGLYLSQLYAQQALLDDALTLQAGRMTTANNFATLPVFTDYVSVAGNGIPTALPVGSTYFTFPPGVQWGAVATVRATDTVTAAAGVYNTNNSSAQPQASANGTDFGLRFDNGAITVGQVTYSLNRGPGDTGLPGIYELGGFYSSADYPRLRDGSEKHGNYGFYGMFQQMVFEEFGTSGSQGLTPWAAVAWNPEESADLLPFFFSAGAVYRGLVPQRDTDTTAVAVYTGKFSDSQPDTSNETVLELNYTVWATPWLAVTPDFQYIFRPFGGSSSNDAAVFGGQIMLIF